jgi:hypothetical protein
MLFFLPVLGIPVSSCGIVLGLLGLCSSFVGAGTLRWSLGGLSVCALALLVNLAGAFAPGGYLSDREVPKLWQSGYDRPYVPPPAPERPCHGPPRQWRGSCCVDWNGDSGQIQPKGSAHRKTACAARRR